MSRHTRPDAVDRAAGLTEGDATFALRADRPEYLEGAEACRASVLTPKDDLGLSPALRYALARRVALGGGNAALLAEYPAPEDSALTSLAEGRTPEDRRLRALAAHADLIARRPGAAGPEDLAALQAAGITVPQIIALSELLAFVCFQIRIAHGLSLLKGTA
ncbi:esterase [Palleronia sp. LCG004]|uniref:CMD domain-containing protein n=1 Tax=Palleronia sp. LCG004 TaxID=3079304 RepID=UPI00294377DB|nr:esterase [Palleronia sp. LCG004]WOI58325.1 esterase [Palleronia sp. LCG004]